MLESMSTERGCLCLTDVHEKEKSLPRETDGGGSQLIRGGLNSKEVKVV